MNSEQIRFPASRHLGNWLEACSDSIVRERIIGVGSPHGDDQFGWAVAELLNENYGVVARKIASPIDLIHELDHCERVVLIDAAIGLPREVSVRKLSFASESDRAAIQELTPRGTHDLGLYQSLRMAEALGKRTDHVEIWVGNALSADRLSPMSSSLDVVVGQCADQIFREVCGARTIVG